MSADASAPSGHAQRVFFALWPDARTAKRLHDLAREAYARCGGRQTRRENLHMTLAFVGDVAAERLEQLIAVGNRVGAEAFMLSVDRLGGWRHNRIVWAGSREIPERLAGLVLRLNAGLAASGFPVERRGFAAHVTLLRNARSVVPEEVIAPIDWRVGGFALMVSQRREDGSHYLPLREWRADPGEQD